MAHRMAGGRPRQLSTPYSTCLCFATDVDPVMFTLVFAQALIAGSGPPGRLSPAQGVQQFPVRADEVGGVASSEAGVAAWVQLDPCVLPRDRDDAELAIIYSQYKRNVGPSDLGNPPGRQHLNQHNADLDVDHVILG